jgi:hypothetical protein
MTRGGGEAYSRGNRGRTVVAETGVMTQEALDTEEVPRPGYSLLGRCAAMEKVCRRCGGCSNRGSSTGNAR